MLMILGVRKMVKNGIYPDLDKLNLLKFANPIFALKDCKRDS